MEICRSHHPRSAYNLRSTRPETPRLLFWQAKKAQQEEAAAKAAKEKEAAAAKKKAEEEAAAKAAKEKAAAEAEVCMYFEVCVHARVDQNDCRS